MNKKTFRWAGAFALALTVAVQAQTPDFLVNAFDSADEVTSWTKWWGAAPQSYDWDSSVDANNSAASGSLKVSVDFDINAYTHVSCL